ncbi:MAG TPA: hypothetical protein VHP56_00620 [Solirubrobacterales bacterium]|jgi:hypothetical protein|nr:hypothetical protein [Solirubrobacterales bacterium]
MSRRDRLEAPFLAALAIALGIGGIFGDRAAAAWPGRDGPVIFLGVRKGASDADPQVSLDGRTIVSLTNRWRTGRRTFPRKLGFASPAYAPSGGALIAVARGGSGPHLVRIPLRDPRHPRPLDPAGLASAPVWTARPKSPN